MWGITTKTETVITNTPAMSVDHDGWNVNRIDETHGASEVTGVTRGALCLKS